MAREIRIIDIINKQVGGVLPNAGLNTNLGRLSTQGIDVGSGPSIQPFLSTMNTALNRQRLEESISRDRRDTFLDQVSAMQKQFKARLTPSLLDTNSAEEMALFNKEQALLSRLTQLGSDVALSPRTAQQKSQEFKALQAQLGAFYQDKDVIRAVQGNAIYGKMLESLDGISDEDIPNYAAHDAAMDAVRRFKSSGSKDSGDFKRLVRAWMNTQANGSISKDTVDKFDESVTQFVDDQAFSNKWILQNMTSDDSSAVAARMEAGASNEQLEQKKLGLEKFIKSNTQGSSIYRYRYGKHVDAQRAAGLPPKTFDQWVKDEVDNKFAIAKRSKSQRNTIIAREGDSAVGAAKAIRDDRSDTLETDNNIREEDNEAANDAFSENTDRIKANTEVAKEARLAAEVDQAAAESTSQSGLDADETEAIGFRDTITGLGYEIADAEARGLANATNKLGPVDLARMVQLAETESAKEGATTETIQNALEKSFLEFENTPTVYRNVSSIVGKGKVQTPPSSVLNFKSNASTANPTTFRHKSTIARESGFDPSIRSGIYTDPSGNIINVGSGNIGPEDLFWDGNKVVPKGTDGAVKLSREPSWGLYQFNKNSVLPQFLQAAEAAGFGKPASNSNEDINAWFNSSTSRDEDGFARAQEAFIVQNVEPKVTSAIKSKFPNLVLDAETLDLAVGTHNQFGSINRVIRDIPVESVNNREDFINAVTDAKIEKFPATKDRFEAERSEFLKTTTPVQSGRRTDSFGFGIPIVGRGEEEASVDTTASAGETIEKDPPTVSDTIAATVEQLQTQLDAIPLEDDFGDPIPEAAKERQVLKRQIDEAVKQEDKFNKLQKDLKDIPNGGQTSYTLQDGSTIQVKKGKETDQYKAVLTVPQRTLQSGTGLTGVGGTVNSPEQQQVIALGSVDEVSSTLIGYDI